MTLHSSHCENAGLWEVKYNDETLLEYVFNEPEDINPAFRLVKTFNGHLITLYRPWDHPWHPGLFFSWKYINGFNFWEAAYHGEQNKIISEYFTPINKDIGFEQGLVYIDQTGNKLLNEHRKIHIEKSKDGYFIDWEAAFQPIEQDVMLDRTKNTVKAPWGGYAGLSCRLNRNFLNPVITADLGEFTADVAFAKKFKWCDYSGKLDGFTKDLWAGICLIESNQNIRFPSKKLTYDYKDMQFLSAAILFDQPLNLRMGETLHLNYSLFIHDGQWNQHFSDLFNNKINSTGGR
ncbi:DUF6807 family protein [Gracilibacillus alcaliphilus]|uniref:DUF6807 family protein n=1 Tax=Gracilibacillus alcaliphilus TaxID=1401441 RepID=UPI001957A064|nr:DUF6807 family protein [Gracilibacillus alcaliphilus]MBM7677637.1 hypothetical protein [Gracilibacillus alcaliphilus]